MTFQEKVPKPFSHFTLLETIGTGSFGTVYKSHDSELDRIVAVKIPRKGQLSTDETEQFLREARAAAQLRHPNIVAVHEVGRDDGHVYIVSDYVEGLSLADWLTAQTPTPREAAELCAKIAEALDHAHQAGIIHRDLKPSNIMLDCDGEPHIMDFGLAKREAGEITMTVEGKVLGTPAYMSPEQAKGEAHHADRRSDVYSLGVILFELLTGERPFRGNMRMLLHQVIHEEAPQPRKLNNRIPRDLETICLKCLEKDAPKRYETAQRVGEELGRFLRGASIHARPIHSAARAWRWCLRNRIVAALAATVGALILLLAVAGPLVAISQTLLKQQAKEKEGEARRSAKDADEARQAAEDEAEQRRRDFYVTDTNVAMRAWETGDVESVRRYLKRHRTAENQTDLRGFEWYYLWKRIRRIEATPGTRLGQPARAVAVSSDGKFVAAACGAKVRFFDSQPPHAELGNDFKPYPEINAPITSLALSPQTNGRILATIAGGNFKL